MGESLLRLMVVELSVNQWDGFWRNCANYVLFLEERSPPFFRIIPVDAGQAFTDATGLHTHWDDFCCLDQCIGEVQHLARRVLTGNFRGRFIDLLLRFLKSAFQPGTGSPIP